MVSLLVRKGFDVSVGQIWVDVEETVLMNSNPPSSEGIRVNCRQRVSGVAVSRSRNLTDQEAWVVFSCRSGRRLTSPARAAAKATS